MSEETHILLKILLNFQRETISLIKTKTKLDSKFTTNLTYV